MFSQRTFDSFDSFVILVNNSEQSSIVREFIHANYNFVKLLVRLLALLCIFYFCFLFDLTVACYKIALDFYRMLSDRIRSKFQVSSNSEAEKVDYFPQEMENAHPIDPLYLEDYSHSLSRSQTDNLEPDLSWCGEDGEPHDLWFDPNYNSKWCRDDDDTDCAANDADRNRATVAKPSKRTVRTELEQLRKRCLTKLSLDL